MWDPSFMFKSCGVGGWVGGLQDFSVSPGSESLSLSLSHWAWVTEPECLSRAWAWQKVFQLDPSTDSIKLVEIPEYNKASVFYSKRSRLVSCRNCQGSTWCLCLVWWHGGSAGVIRMSVCKVSRVTSRRHPCPMSFYLVRTCSLSRGLSHYWSVIY